MASFWIRLCCLRGKRRRFSWVGGSMLGSCFASNTSSHYDWAMKKLKAHKKNCAGK